MNRLVIDLDIPKMKGKSITYQSGTPRDVVIKRVDGTIVGRIGDYHDVLYAPYEELRDALGTNINKATGRPYIDISLSEKAIRDQISKWRTDILKGKISFITSMAPTLKGKTKKAKFQYQESAIQEDLVRFLNKYDFLKPARKMRAQLQKDIINSPRGGKPIKTQKEQVAEKVKQETEGLFISGEQQSKIIKSKYNRRMFTKDRDKIIKNIKDDLDDIFPDDGTPNNRKSKK